MRFFGSDRDTSSAMPMDLHIPRFQQATTLSEELCRRDNFFHSCWMHLKVLRPDLMKEMQNIEISVAGITPPDKEADNDTEKPVDTIL